MRGRAWAPPDHPATRAALAHKQYLAERLGELCAATGTGTTDHPVNLCQDMLLIYEGMNNLIALDLDPDPVGRARQLAHSRLNSPA